MVERWLTTGEDGLPIEDESGNLVIDEEKLSGYTDTLSKVFDTVGSNIDWEKKSGEVVTVKNEMPGYIVDKEAEAANIKETFNFYSGLFEFDKEKFKSLIETFGLPKNKAVRTFSKGMKRQLFVALALSAKADNLLLDEAFDGLDPMVVDVIKGEIIECASQNKTIVVSSHNILALERLADRFVVLNKGQVAKQGSQEDIGVEFVKYQAAFKFKANEQNIADLGYEVVSFRSVGSVSHFVIYEAPGALEHIKEKLDPLFIEQVPFEPDEVLTLEMMAAKKKEGGENA